LAIWNILKNDADCKLMAETLGISEITAYVLANRGLRSKASALKFLNPVLSSLSDASVMKDIPKAAAIIKRAIQKNVKIAVYGDYDVDGVFSAVILYKTLKKFGADVSIYIPQREEEGYGLNDAALNKLIRDQGVKLIITCDNGISAIPEIEAVKDKAAVIIFDHHEPGYTEENGVHKDNVLPDANAIINPKQIECPYPFKKFSAAGICYRFAEYFHEINSAPFTDQNDFLIFAAIATFCDIVELTDENRIIAKNGLKLLNEKAYKNIANEIELCNNNPILILGGISKLNRYA